MGMALVKYDTLEALTDQIAQMRAAGLCAFAWTTQGPDGFHMAVACIKKKGHRTDHVAWGGHSQPRSKK